MVIINKFGTLNYVVYRSIDSILIMVTMNIGMMTLRFKSQIANILDIYDSFILQARVGTTFLIKWF